MADIYFKRTKIIGGHYWQMVAVRNVKPEERGGLALDVQEYRTICGDISSSPGFQEKRYLKGAREAMAAAGHVLHYDPPVSEARQVIEALAR